MSNEPSATPETPTTTPSPSPELSVTPLAGEPAAEPPKTEPVAVEPPVVLTAEHFKDLIPAGTDVSKDAHFTKFLETMNDSKLSAGDRATALYKLQGEVLTSLAEKQAADFTKMNDEWREKVFADPVYGGTKLAETTAAIGKLVDKYGDAELRDAMDLTGAGNHPAFVRMMAKIAKDMNEPTLNNTPVTPASQASIAEVIYNHPTSKGK